MKKTATAAVLAAMSLALSASAHAGEGARFGYVDMNRIMTQSKAGQRHRADMERLVKDKQEKLAKEQGRIKSLQEDFEKNRLVLTDKQKQEKQREFQEKTRAYQTMAGEAQQEVGQKDAEFTQKALAEVRAIIRGLAQEEKLALVFEKNEQPVLYAEDGPDLTERVMQRFDAKLGAK